MELCQVSKPYHNDNSIIYSCQYHVIFCTKYRRKVLTDEISLALKKIVSDNQSEGYSIIEMEVMPDHVHLLLDVDPRVGIYSIVTRIKGVTSHHLRNEFQSLKSRLPTLWTRGKFISSVGAMTLDVVKQYIESQKGV